MIEPLRILTKTPGGRGSKPTASPMPHRVSSSTRIPDFQADRDFTTSGRIFLRVWESPGILKVMAERRSGCLEERSTIILQAYTAEIPRPFRHGIPACN